MMRPLLTALALAACVTVTFAQTINEPEPAPVPQPSLIVNAEQIADNAGQKLSTPIAGGKLTTSGSLAVSFVAEQGFLPTKAYREPTEQPELPLIETPLFSAKIMPTERIVSLQLDLNRKDPKTELRPSMSRVMLSRIEPGKVYSVVFTWDIVTNRFDVYLNGTLQEVISPITIPFWEEGTPDLAGGLTVPCPSSGSPNTLRVVELFDKPLTKIQVASLARAHQAPALAGEGRTVYTEPLEVTSEGKEKVFEADFSKPLDLTIEADLFADGKRVKEPTTQWVLEADGTARTEDSKLVLETSRWTPPNRWENGAPIWEKPGHIVLWLNQRFPDGILVEYDLEVFDSKRGLHILFFAAQAADGGSIFQPGLKAREGDFRNYIFNSDEYLSYHISFWAAPFDIVRRTSNLRKNNNFFLLAAGDDRIVEQGPGPHRIRVLKDGERIAAEVNGIKIMDFIDRDGLHGPVLQDGYLGLRMMGDAKWIKISNFTVYKLP